MVAFVCKAFKSNSVAPTYGCEWLLFNLVGLLVLSILEPGCTALDAALSLAIILKLSGNILVWGITVVWS
ncbi:MAG TPA: hypothetical protein DCY55_00190 [Gammaproteobacteria bacterium]|nr:hypothetical protein [Gammaproteobacteria bacterium]